MLFIAPDIWKYIILPYVTKPLYGKIICLNQELNNYCQEGLTTINIKISNNKEEILKWLIRKNIYIILNLSYNSTIIDDNLKLLLNLRKLYLYNNNTITDESLKLLVNLRTIGLDNNSTITDDSLKLLVNLRTLYLDNNSTITDGSLKLLVNLRTLYLYNNRTITDDSLKLLVNLRTFGLDNDSTITDDSLKLLVNLRTLYLHNRPEWRPASRTTITDEMITVFKQRGVIVYK
jgi:hypothetical protein